MRKKMLYILTTALVVSMFAGCGSKKENPQKNDTTKTTSVREETSPEESGKSTDAETTKGSEEESTQDLSGMTIDEIFPQDGDYETDKASLPAYVIFDGHKVERGMLLKEFISSNYEVDSVRTNRGELDKVPAESTAFVSLREKRSNATILFSIYNDSDEDLEWQDTKVKGIYYELKDADRSFYQDSDSNLGYELDNGVQLCGSINQVKKAYEGIKPDYVSNSDNNTQVEYTDGNTSHRIIISLDIPNNQVTAIEFVFADNE